MTSPKDEYIFTDAGFESELSRLRAIERIFDAKTIQLLSQTGSLTGRRCLEVGAGAGSIASWLGTRTGSKGRVVALDTNARFLSELMPPIQVVQGDVLDATVAREPFDLIHARYVLIHNQSSAAVLDALLSRLSPDGWLCLEEPDFSTACAICAPARLRTAFDRVSRAIEATFGNRGQDHALGRRLVQMVAEHGLTIAEVACDSPVVPGGSPLAGMMRMSTRQLRDKYLATGMSSEQDLTLYDELSEDPNSWVLHYSTVRLLARLAPAGNAAPTAAT